MAGIGLYRIFEGRLKAAPIVEEHSV
jgi:hypothetical protein